MNTDYPPRSLDFFFPELTDNELRELDMWSHIDFTKNDTEPMSLSWQNIHIVNPYCPAPWMCLLHFLRVQEMYPQALPEPTKRELTLSLIQVWSRPKTFPANPTPLPFKFIFNWVISSWYRNLDVLHQNYSRGNTDLPSTSDHYRGSGSPSIYHVLGWQIKK